jgi:hypothetical protein
MKALLVLVPAPAAGVIAPGCPSPAALVLLLLLLLLLLLAVLPAAPALGTALPGWLPFCEGGVLPAGSPLPCPLAEGAELVVEAFLGAADPRAGRDGPPKPSPAGLLEVFAGSLGFDSASCTDAFPLLPCVSICTMLLINYHWLCGGCR